MLSLRTQSICRYRIHGDVPSPFGEEFHRRLYEGRFLPLHAEEDRAYGWVSADNLLVTEFAIDSVVRGEYAAFALRVDQRRVNARLLRAQIDLEVLARLKAARDAGGPAKLGREERKELREDLHRKLLRETTPSVDAFTVLLHPRRKILTVLSLSKRANELTRLHFLDTFEATLVPLTPWQRSSELLEEQAKRGGVDLRPALEDLRRTDFTRAGASPSVDLAGSADVAVMRPEAQPDPEAVSASHVSTEEVSTMEVQS